MRVGVCPEGISCMGKASLTYTAEPKVGQQLIFSGIGSVTVTFVIPSGM